MRHYLLSIIALLLFSSSCNSDEDKYDYEFSLTTDEYFECDLDYVIPMYTNGNLDNLYQLYDDLVAVYPNYVSKSLLGKDAWDNPIFRYDFANGVDKESLYKGIFRKNRILIVTHTHGPEIQSGWGAYVFFKLLCDNTGNDFLDYMKINLRFTVIPIAVPTGFIDASPKNRNRININRNFEYKHNIVDPSNLHYGGQLPLSELESQYINNLLVGNNGKDIIFAIDKHNDDSYYARNYVSWTGSLHSDVQGLLVKWADFHNQIIRKNYSFLKEKEGKPLARVFDSKNVATMSKQFYLNNIKGITYETTQLREEISLSEKQKFEVESFGNFLYLIAKSFNGSDIDI